MHLEHYLYLLQSIILAGILFLLYKPKVRIPKKLYIGGLYLKTLEQNENGELHPAMGWELQGIFISKKLALNACSDSNYFIAPVKLNQTSHNKTIMWDNAYYPHDQPDKM